MEKGRAYSGKSKGSESCIDPDMLGEARGFRTGVLFTGEELLYGNGDDDAAATRRALKSVWQYMV